ncbi:MAG TPA: DUF1801 domain-containing protein [Cyclobacteriaceae bacterium]|jgi:uncharacterized protein YdhG (YjbR/CyaY superfamily)
MKMIKAKDVDAYIAGFPNNTQKLLKQIRATVKKAAPKAVEAISYGMPVLKLNGNLVYFAAYKFHIGFYPSSSGIRTFEKEISKYKWSKGAVQFPIDKPMPLSLITKIVKFRVRENLAKGAKKK